MRPANLFLRDLPSLFRSSGRRHAAALLVAGLFATGYSSVRAFARSAGGDEAAPVPVVVELFTSEGCSSCPPLDTLLRKIDALQPIKGVEVIGVEEHVDYWNQDGWVDPYSALEWTERQQEYVSRFKDRTAYTPQMIVDGDKEMVNPTPAGILAAIRQAAQQQSLRVSIEAGAADGNDAQNFGVRVTSPAGAPNLAKADVWLAVTEGGLHMDVTGGENKGRTLEHAAVVRSLEKIGSISSKDKSPFASDRRVKFKSSWKRPNLHVVVFVQDHKTLRIVGAASAKVAG
jgi:hypothetical protein